MSLLERLGSWAGTPHHRIGAQVFRVLAGTTVLYQYLVNYAQRRLLYGPESLYPYELFLERQLPSLYSLSRDPWYFELIFHLGIVLTFAWTVGIKSGPVMTVLVWTFWMSVRNRFPELWDGGDNLMELLLVYAVFAVLRSRSAGPSSEPWLSRTRAVLHNGAVLAMSLQICVVYVVAGVTKIHGQTWWNGTALYYALVDAEFVYPGVSEVLYANDLLVAFLSYATVAFQVSFPFLLCINRYTRLIAVGVGISFHLSIIVVLGLTSFGMFMIAADLVLVSDEEYRWLGRAMSRSLEFLASWKRQLVTGRRSSLARQ